MLGKIYKSKIGRIIYPLVKPFKPTKVITKLGFIMNVHQSRDYISDSLLLKKEWEKSKYKILSKFVKEGDVVGDIGANIGYYTLILSKLVGKGIVYALEPETKSYNLLKENIFENKINNVVALNLAVSRVEGKNNLFFGKDTHGGGSIINYQQCAGSERVITTTLDKLFEECTIDFLKMDIEGSEFNAMMGGEKTLEKIKGILVEFIPHSLYNKMICDPEEFVDILERHKFYLYDVDEVTVKLSSFDLEKFKRTWRADDTLFKDILGLKEERKGDLI